jgi:PQQ-dependent catabolism-associated CXXCW motif protein
MTWAGAFQLKINDSDVAPSVVADATQSSAAPASSAAPSGGPINVRQPNRKRVVFGGAVAAAVALLWILSIGHQTAQNPTPAPPAPTPAPATRPAPTPAPPQPAIPDRNYADERTDFGVKPQNFLQTDVEGPTPTTIPGDRIVSTSGLYTALAKNPDAAILIDALNGSGHATLPDAHRLPEASSSGRFNDSIQRNLAAELRSLTGGNRETTLVFFCLGARCWESYNAALRAIRLGFQDVYWYRGGLDAWKEAGLPLR